eukprot:UN02809
MSVEDKSPDAKISASLFALGLPIIQGAISTILGVIGLAFAPSLPLHHLLQDDLPRDPPG